MTPATRVWVAYCPGCTSWLTGWHDTEAQRDAALARHDAEVLHA